MAVVVLSLTPSVAFGHDRRRFPNAPGPGLAPALHHRTVRAHASVIGGRPAEPGSFPWLAYVADFVGEEEFICTGTVVAPDLVLTAGHCAEDAETGEVREPGGYRVFTGNVDWTSSESRLSDVSKVIIYPGYHPSGSLEGWGDAALLELSTPTTAPAIELATSEMWEAGTGAVIDGWGDTYYGEEWPPEQLS